VANLFRAGGGDMPLLPHTWSLAMEEQFYLIWPVLLIGLLSIRNAPRRTISWVIALGIAVSFATRVVLSLNGSSLKRLHNGPDLAAGVLLIGCLLAVWAHGLARSPMRHPAAFWLGMAAIIGTSMGEKSVSLYLVWLPLAIVGAALVIAHLASGGAANTVNRLMTFPPLLYLGKISYGLYLWHYTVYWVVKQHVKVYPYKPLLQISLSLIVAAIS
jgi:peptidoglycan/LPS O-acetylase OafA/YrhL